MDGRKANDQRFYLKDVGKGGSWPDILFKGWRAGRPSARDPILGMEGREVHGQRFHLKDAGHGGSWPEIPFKGLMVGRLMAKY